MTWARARAASSSTPESKPSWISLISERVRPSPPTAEQPRGIPMPYQAEISRENHTCFLFVIDQSGSMDEITETGRSKADFVADVLNKTLYTLVTTCSKADGVRNYFDVGVIAYGGTEVVSGFGGALAGGIVHPINAISEHTLRVEERQKKVDDGAGGILELKTKFPVWF